MSTDAIDWHADIITDPAGRTAFHAAARDRLARLADHVGAGLQTRRIATDMISPLVSGETSLRAGDLCVRVEQPQHWPYLGVLVRVGRHRPAWWPLEALDDPAMMADRIGHFRRNGTPPSWPETPAPSTAHDSMDSVPLVPAF